MLNADKVLQRIDLVGSSAGSIVSVATWCTLHAYDFHAIMNCIGDKIKSDATTDTRRASLIYVLHEVLLTCATRGVSQGAQRTVLTAITATLPICVESVFQKTPIEAHGSFMLALEKVLVWWSALNMFPRVWIDNLEKNLQQKEMKIKASNLSRSNPSSMLSDLQRLTHLMSRYEDAKQQWKMCQSTMISTNKDVTRDIAMTVAYTQRALITLREAVKHSQLSGAVLSQWCDEQWRELEGQEPSNAKTENDSKRVKMEVNRDANLAPEEDILSSFY